MLALPCPAQVLLVLVSLEVAPLVDAEPVAEDLLLEEAEHRLLARSPWPAHRTHLEDLAQDSLVELYSEVCWAERLRQPGLSFCVPLERFLLAEPEAEPLHPPEVEVLPLLEAEGVPWLEAGLEPRLQRPGNLPLSFPQAFRELLVVLSLEEPLDSFPVRPEQQPRWSLQAHFLALSQVGCPEVELPSPTMPGWT